LYIDPEGGSVSLVGMCASANTNGDQNSFSYAILRILDPSGAVIATGSAFASVCGKSGLAGTYILQGRRLASVFTAFFYNRSLLAIGSKR
jgi:hypothetical protein